MDYQTIYNLLEDDAEYLLEFDNPQIPKNLLHLPGQNFVKEIFSQSNRSEKVIKNLKTLYGHGRLADTGYLSIFPVDQGIEHSAGESFSKNPLFFDPGNVVRFAIEAECNAVTSSVGVLGMVSKKYVNQIPFIVKLNHNDLFRFPNDHDQIMFTTVERAYDMGAQGVGATIYFGSPESKRQIVEVGKAFARAHELGMFTVLWCYVRNPNFVIDGVDYQDAADLTGQANHIGATLEADIVKQKLPTKNGGYLAINEQENFGKFDERMYTELTSEHPIDLCRYQVANGYMGRVSLITSGGESGDDDLYDVVRSAVINKRAGGSGLIVGRKAFQKEWDEGLEIVQAVQDVYLCEEINIA